MWLFYFRDGLAIRIFNSSEFQILKAVAGKTTAEKKQFDTTYADDFFQSSMDRKGEIKIMAGYYSTFTTWVMGYRTKKADYPMEWASLSPAIFADSRVLALLLAAACTAVRRKCGTLKGNFP